MTNQSDPVLDRAITPEGSAIPLELTVRGDLGPTETRAAAVRHLRTIEPLVDGPAQCEVSISPKASEEGERLYDAHVRLICGAGCTESEIAHGSAFDALEEAFRTLRRQLGGDKKDEAESESSSQGDESA
jgi:hypothetical protein